MDDFVKKILFVAIVIGFAFLLSGFHNSQSEKRIRHSFYFGQGLSILEQQRNQLLKHDFITMEKLTIKQGETLAQKLAQTSLESDTTQTIITKLNPAFPLSQIRSGQELVLLWNNAETPSLLEVRIPLSTQRYLSLEAKDDFTPQEKTKRFIRKVRHVDGIINNNFYETSQEFNIPFSIFLQYIRLMSFDVSFQQDIRVGTEFAILFEELYDNSGKRVDYGDILIATLRLSDKREFTYYHYERENGHADYYSRGGYSARKLLMKTPLDGSRISSTFGKRRHPILGYTRQHKGLDFAANRGTPIYAAGSGTVSARGYNRGGYGRYIVIKHDQTYSTLYAHMDSFGRNVRRGRKVDQQQIIGFVGSTGRSTGPHLHYEIRKNDKQINPLRTKFKPLEKIKGAEYERLQQASLYLDNIAKYHDNAEIYNITLFDWLRYRKHVAAIKSNRF